MNLFEEYPYDFTVDSDNYIDLLIKEDEYKYFFDIYEGSLNTVFSKIYDEFLKSKLISKSNSLITIDFIRFYNLFLAAITLDRIIEKHPNEIIEVDVEKEELNLGSRYVNLYGLMAEKIGTPFKINVKSFEHRDLVFGKYDSSTKDKILKLLVYDFNFIWYYIKNNFLSKKQYHKIPCFGENLINREIKTVLFKKNVRTFKIDHIIDNVFNIESELILPKNIQKFTDNLIKKEFLKVESIFRNQDIMSAYIKIFSSGVKKSLGLIFEKQAQLRNEIKNINDNKINKICLTNGLFGIKGLLIYDALKFNNYHVVSSQHGLTPGISLHTNFSKSSEIFTCDTLFTYNKSSIRVLKRINDVKSKLIAIGAPKTSKNVNNRILNRIYLKFKFRFKGPQVLYLSGINPVNSLKSYPTVLANSEIFKHNIKILNVLSKIDKRVSFKDYPTEQFLFSGHLFLKNLFESSVKFLNKDIDFRYIRPIFDIIITNASQSTLEWCIGSKVPLVYLYDKKIMPLESEKIENIFKECFFFFNYDDQNWPNKLKIFLNLPYSEIMNLWKIKQKKLNHYDKEYFLSSKKNSGQIGANYLVKKLKIS